MVIKYKRNYVASEDQEKNTFTYLYGTFAFKRILFSFCNAPATFQHCIMSMFSNMVIDTIEVLMDNFSIAVNRVMLVKITWTTIYKDVKSVTWF